MSRASGPGADLGPALAGLVGAAHVLAGDRARAVAVDGVAPGLVVQPGSVEEVSGVLALAAARGLAVVPAGTGLRLGWGAPPRAVDLLLSLARLDQVLDHEPADLTLSVQAGARLGVLAGLLRPHGQFLPLDPARAAESTVGGLVATAASGPYRARYGTMRDLLLGLTVVSADGTVVRGGGRVVKNVTGYDMPKLHVGALGTLGVVVEAHLRLHPAPAEEGSWAFGFGSPEAALEAAVSLRDTPAVVSRLELLNGHAVEAAGPPGAAAALAVTIGSVPEAVRAQAGQVADAARRAGGTPLEIGAADAWWARVTGATWAAGADPGLALRIGTRPGDVVKALRAVEASAADVPVTATAGVANGVLRARLPAADETAAPALIGRIRAALRPLDGTCVVEHAAPSVKAAVDVWGDVGPAIGAMRRLKAEMDPRGVLNPGRFVGGI